MDTANLLNLIFRTVQTRVDYVVYSLLKFNYQLFFNIASLNLLSGDVIYDIFSRVQLILGVFMMFQLAMSIVKGIMNPDTFVDKKTGFGNIIVRVLISLILLGLIVPLNIESPKNNYEKHLNNSGVLFGTLYSLQERLLGNNTIGKLIFGNDENNYTSMDEDGYKNLESKSNYLSSTVIKVFYKKNTDAYGNFICETMSSSKVDAELWGKVYDTVDASPLAILALAEEKCSPEAEGDNAIVPGDGIAKAIWNIVSSIKKDGGSIGIGALNITGEVYALSITPILPTIVGIIIVWLLFKMTFDIAVRVFKLMGLQLIAPIPIISYMNPTGSKDSAFNAWVKTLTSTYVELFVHLAVIYFVISLIGGLMDNIKEVMYIQIKENPGWGGSVLLEWTYIIMVIGLLIFAKNAPKFFKQALGIKGEGSFFASFGTAMGIGTAAVRSVGSFAASARASKMSDETRAAYGEKDIFGREINPNSTFNKGKHAAAGIFGGFMGFKTGVDAAFNAKDHQATAVMTAMNKHDAAEISKGNSGSSFIGRMGSIGSSMLYGEGSAAQLEREISTNKSRLDALKEIKARVSSEMVKSDYTIGSLGITGADGKLARANYKDFMSRYEAAKSQGLSDFKYLNLTTGQEETITMKVANDKNGYLLKTNEDNYIKRMLGTYTPTPAEINQGDNVNNYRLYVNSTDPDKNEKRDDVFAALVRSAEELGGAVKFQKDANDRYIKVGDTHITDRNSINDSIDGLNIYNTQLSRRNATNKSNDRFTGTNKNG